MTNVFGGRYIHLRRKLESERLLSEQQIQLKLRRSIYKHVMCELITSEPGLPRRIEKKKLKCGHLILL